MKLGIPYINCLSNSLEDLTDTMESLRYHPIENSPWGAATPCPSVRFKMAHGNHFVFLVYDVWENETLGRFSEHNKPVYRDSCVEFFIRFKNEQNYYNLEFNCLGACLAGWGPNRNNRKLLAPEIISQIKSYTKISRKNNDKMPLIHWQLTLKIPVTVFVHSNVHQLLRQKATANFYKCGDELSQPHYMSWNNIKTSAPDFHQPRFFREIEFL